MLEVNIFFFFWVFLSALSSYFLSDFSLFFNSFHSCLLLFNFFPKELTCCSTTRVDHLLIKVISIRFWIASCVYLKKSSSPAIIKLQVKLPNCIKYSFLLEETSKSYYAAQNYQKCHIVWHVQTPTFLYTSQGKRIRGKKSWLT